MTIVIGCDHAAFELKEFLKEFLEKKSYTVTDVGTHSTASVDYPDFAHSLCKEIEEGRSELGVLLCGSGIGVSIAANRHNSIRAALATNTEMASLARQHNKANVVCLGARFTAPHYASVIVEAFLAASFEGGKHARRVGKLGC